MKEATVVSHCPRTLTSTHADRKHVGEVSDSSMRLMLTLSPARAVTQLVSDPGIYKII